MKEQSDFYRLIKKLCYEKNIKFRQASFGYVTELKKDGIIRHIVGNSLELNSASAYKIASDKFATYSILVQNNIPVIKHNMVFNPETRSEYENDDIKKALIWFQEYGGKAIVKANNSSEGKDVFLVKTKEELKKRILECFMNNKDSVSICPVYNINYEYRVIILDNEILACYKKEKPFVIGDGICNLNQLIEKSEIPFFYNNLDLKYIPKKGEKIEVYWKHNLAQGAKPSFEIDIEKKKRIFDIALKVRRNTWNKIC